MSARVSEVQKLKIVS